MTNVTDRLDALEASSARLASRIGSLSSEQLTSPSYASKWTIADVLSHMGSGAVIMRRAIDAAVSGDPVEDGFNQSVWDEWNAKSPDDKATAALAADRALLDRVAAMSADERASFQRSMGPFTLDLSSFLGLRLNEHVLHTWDIDVAIDPGATLPADAVEIVIDNLGMIAGFAGKSDGNERDIAIHTTEPDREILLKVGPERLSLEPSVTTTAADLELPSEAFVRLVYGRLDPAHTPPGVAAPELDDLRKMFPGL
jgi:uncharacterized protein (TIGR03083 family)